MPNIYDSTSSLEVIRRICGDKWKFLTICYLFNGPRRFSELQYYLEPIAQKVLTENLRELENLGLLYHISYPKTPPHTEYALTALGKSLQPIFQDLIVWGINYSREQRRQMREENGQGAANQ